MATRDDRSMGLRVWRVAPAGMPVAHVHSDLELNLLTAGSMRYFMVGRMHRVTAGRLVAFWASMPHQLTEVEAGARGLWMTLPLAWFLRTDPPGGLVEALLGGRLVQASGRSDEAELDRAALERWRADLRRPTAEVRRIVMLEAEARLRRLAVGLRAAGPGDRALPKAEAMAAYLSKRYREPMDIKRVADHVGLHPNYAMQLFGRVCGMSIGQYLLRLRVSHAQRLLITTDRKILDVAMDAGFGSVSRFYEGFGELVGATPRQYRRTMRAAAG